MATSWEEVKRLAADFQRAQLSSSVQRLSDRNCIEIVKHLVSLKLIEVVFTTSGKEYITPQHLYKEVKDELIAAGGRTDLSSLAANLQVDLLHIETAVAELVKTEKNVKLVLDQLISDSYMDRLAEEVNERLQQKGELSMVDIIKGYDVPAEFLRAGLMSRMGRIIKGQVDDKEVLYTEAFVTMHQYRIRGVLSAVTKPIQISTLIKNYGFPQRIVVGIVEQLISQKKLLGSLSGHGFYIPDIYSRAQREWVSTGFSQNGFLEYDALSRLGVGDPKAFVKSLLHGKQLLFLSSACIGEHLLSQVESSIEEANLTGSWVDVASMLPSQLIPADVNQVISHVISKDATMNDSIHIVADTIVASDGLLESCLSALVTLIKERAKGDSQNGVGQLCEVGDPLPDIFGAERRKKATANDDETDRKEERRKKAAWGKSGGGTQGRETKTKSTKRKYGKKKASGFEDTDDDAPEADKGAKQQESELIPRKKIVCVSLEDIRNCLSSLELLQGGPVELVIGMAELTERRMYEKYSRRWGYKLVTGPVLRKTHSELQERISTIVTQITLYAAGLQIFTDDLKTQLTKHLLRTLCSDIFNAIVVYLAGEHGPVDVANPNPEQRLKMINKIGGTQKEALIKVHQNLAGSSIDEFFENMDAVYGAGVLDMMIRVDRKRDRQTISAHKASLIGQLSVTTEPALALHLAVLVLVQTQMQKMVHFSGKFVPQMVSFLQGKVPSDLHAELVAAEELVIKNMRLQEGAEKNQLQSELQTQTTKLKRLVINYKRLSESK